MEPLKVDEVDVALKKFLEESARQGNPFNENDPALVFFRLLYNLFKQSNDSFYAYLKDANMTALADLAITEIKVLDRHKKTIERQLNLVVDNVAETFKTDIEKASLEQIKRWEQLQIDMTNSLYSQANQYIKTLKLMIVVNVLLMIFVFFGFIIQFFWL